MYTEIDYNEYNIRLNSGTEIEFNKNGEWEEIKTYNNFPAEILPNPAIKAIKNYILVLLLLKQKKDGMVMKLK